MRFTKFVLVAAAVLALMPSPGNAQDRKIHVNLGGGPTFLEGDLGEHFANGWGPAIGITFDGPNSHLGFQFEYAYRWFDIKDDALILTPPIELTLEYAVEFIADDELVEVTPKSIRIRKRLLQEHERKRASRVEEALLA